MYMSTAGVAIQDSKRSDLESEQTRNDELKARIAELEQQIAEAKFFGKSTLDPADVTHAVDRFARMPDKQGSEEITIPMKAKDETPQGPDPFKLVNSFVRPLSEFIVQNIGSENPVLEIAATQFFANQTGKYFRPTIIALLARTLAHGSASEASFNRQMQLGAITEMIHGASLVHDDVLDEADTRRGGLAVHKSHATKVAVLTGDFLLARASQLMARLRHTQVVEVMASALDALVHGELKQASTKKEDLTSMDYYLRKSYFKTSSLISCSCKSTALLAGYDENDPMTVAAEEFGYHLGMAYQVVDDILDFKGESASLGKPSQADMELGLATAPILFAMEEEPSLRPLIERQFKKDGDIQDAVSLAFDTDCIEKSYGLAEFHAQKGLNALMRMPASENRDALVVLMHKVLSRQK
jgi:geranyl diphosphate synthase